MCLTTYFRIQAPPESGCRLAAAAAALTRAHYHVIMIGRVTSHGSIQLNSGPCAAAGHSLRNRHGQSADCGQWQLASDTRNNRGIARAPPDSERPLGPRPRGKEDNKSLENNAGSGSRARLGPALGINICYVRP